MDRRMAINESVVSAEFGGEAVLLNVESGIYFGLDATGNRIWSLLGVGATEAEIFGHLLEEYDVEPPRLRADLAAFLDLLAGKGLAHFVDGDR